MHDAPNALMDLRVCMCVCASEMFGTCVAASVMACGQPLSPNASIDGIVHEVLDGTHEVHVMVVGLRTAVESE